MKIKLLLFTTCLLVLNTGCFKNGAPSCTNKEVKATVMELYLEVSGSGYSLGKLTLPNTMTSLDNVRPTSYDKEIKLRTCKANAHFDTGDVMEIEYTVQLMEDTNQPYIELKNDFAQQLLQQKIYENLNKNFQKK